LIETEQVVKGRRIEPTLVRLARMAVASEIRPIDDMRSTARYRAAVAANLVEKFLEQLRADGKNE
jgi:xanthine dehydrogenase iron-sulfur cluster and FAD-binding subunit A